MTASPHTKELVLDILRIGDRGGTDIKLDLGFTFRFQAFRPAGVRITVSRWQIFFTTVISGSIQHTSLVLNFNRMSTVSSGGRVL